MQRRSQAPEKEALRSSSTTVPSAHPKEHGAAPALAPTWQRSLAMRTWLRRESGGRAVTFCPSWSTTASSARRLVLGADKLMWQAACSAALNLWPKLSGIGAVSQPVGIDEAVGL
mmetsp:Transcript_97984/g.245457  ORF Transcript_97984/g.245457 Transcript_97984/m.245457 type:complete len:115 (+) Transcript_97984:386-730(+)